MNRALLMLCGLLLATGACSLFAPKAPTHDEKCALARAMCARAKPSDATTAACVKVALECTKSSSGGAASE